MTRDLKVTLHAASKRHKQVFLKSTIASKTKIIKISECKELTSIKVKKETEKKERTKQRKKKATQKKAESQAKRSSENNASDLIKTT